MTSDSIKFVHVTTFFPPDGFGGDAVQVHRLVEGLARRGHDVTVIHAPEAFAAGAGAPMEGLDSPVGVDVVAASVGRRGLLASYLVGRPWGFRGQLRAVLDDADVVHFHNPSLIGGPGAILLADRALALYTTHEHWLVCPTHVLFRNGREPCEQPTCFRCTLRHHRPPQMWRHGSLLPRAIRRLDLVLAPSEFTATRHRRSFPDAPIEVLRHPPPTVDRLAAVGDPPARSRPYVLFAGRLEPIKGARWLVDALREDEGVDVVLAGDGKERDRIAADIVGIPHFKLIGKVPHDEVLRWAKGALALVIPSIGYETSGAVGLEAMALGTPVIVRDLGALPELVASGGGTTFQDPSQLRHAIVQLRDDRGHAARLRQEAVTVADAVAGDNGFFERYFRLLADAAHRTGRHELAMRSEAAAASGEKR